MADIREVFENKIKIDSKVVSLETLFNNEERVKNTNFKPSYQRNYVWDDEKATYFIESILLGTEIPPLIYFRNISKVEIIDGRQRYQTILRFLKNEFKLKKSGLKKLDSTDFINKSFDSLSNKYKKLLFETKLRIIEFSFNTKSGIDDSVEDLVKKEIFKRYNSGITPLKSTEVEKAEYLDNNVNKYFKENVLSDKILETELQTLFYFEKTNKEILLKKIRELLVIHNIPIKYYSIKKNNIINLYFEYAFSNPQEYDVKELKDDFISKINIIKKIYSFINNKSLYNRLISECLFWALSIYSIYKKNLLFSEADLKQIALYIDNNIESYGMDRSSFAIHIRNRYENVSKIFELLFGIDFTLYIEKTEEFNKELHDINTINENEDKLSFDDLRLNKPEPSSISIDDIIRAMSRQEFIIRPQYQRNEVIDKRKASSIIESILLGIKLPPIFVYKNKDGISEVIDGQQRLLSILGFIGEEYITDENVYESSRIDKFSLNLKNGILSNLNSSKFKDLDPEYREKIKNFDLWIIEIDHKYNPDFDEIDLFIRLNYKPYPIKLDSFEMWNSYISRELIDTIKDIYRNHKDWFYLRKNTTRMENENILAALIYLYYEFNINKNSDSKYSELDFYKVNNKINIRLRSKSDITKKFENVADDLVFYANYFETDFLYKLKVLTSEPETYNADVLDYIFNVDNGRRTQQSLYALFYFLNEIPLKTILTGREELINSLKNLYIKMNNVDSLLNFKKDVSFFKSKFISQSYNIYEHNNILLSDIAYLFKGISKSKNDISLNINEHNFIKSFNIYNDNFEYAPIKSVSVKNFPRLYKDNVESSSKLIIQERIELDFINVFFDTHKLHFDNSYIGLVIKRPSISYKYLYSLLTSKYFFEVNFKNTSSINISILSNTTIPYFPRYYQDIFDKFFDIIYSTNDSKIKNYFINIIDSLAYMIINLMNKKNNFLYVFLLLDELVKVIKQGDQDQIYLDLSQKDSLLSNYLLKLNYQ